MPELDRSTKLHIRLNYFPASSLRTSLKFNHLLVEGLHLGVLCIREVVVDYCVNDCIELIVHFAFFHQSFQDFRVAERAKRFAVKTSAAGSDHPMLELSNERACANVKNHRPMVAYAFPKREESEATNLEASRGPHSINRFAAINICIRLLSIPRLVGDLSQTQT